MILACGGASWPGSGSGVRRALTRTLAARPGAPSRRQKRVYGRNRTATTTTAATGVTAQDAFRLVGRAS